MEARGSSPCPQDPPPKLPQSEPVKCSPVPHAVLQQMSSCYCISSSFGYTRKINGALLTQYIISTVTDNNNNNNTIFLFGI